MLLAVALMLSAPDHWPAFVSGGHAHDHGHHGTSPRQEQDHHSRHCHGDAATCSDLPLTTVFGLAALAAWLAFGLNGPVRAVALPPGLRWRSQWLRVPHPPPRTPLPAGHESTA